MLGLARRAVEAGQRHAIASLVPSDPAHAETARALGVPVHDVTSPSHFATLADAFDIVLVHWWNSPEMDTFLRAPLPPIRLALWIHVGGTSAPQVVTRSLLALPDIAIGCSPVTLEAMQDTWSGTDLHVVLAGAEFDPLKAVQPQPHSGFTVGYVGTAASHKMHPNYISMSSKARLEDARFIVCGDGELEQLRAQAAETACPEAFEIRGFVDSVADVFASLDVYGYPLCHDTYAAAELNLQEAMYCGVPPVVFPHGGVRLLVDHGINGLVVENETDYALALEQLHDDPAERLRLGTNARRKAQTEFGAENTFKNMERVCQSLMARPKQSRSGLGNGIDPATGFERFMDSLGENDTIFRISAGLTPGDMEQADTAIANASPLMASRWSGGILHWASAWREDPWLAYWSGLVQEKSAPDRAHEAFCKAEQKGLNTPRLSRRIRRTTDATHTKEL